jgi:hypothetical protein
MPICTPTSFDFVALSFMLIDGKGLTLIRNLVETVHTCAHLLTTPLHFKGMWEPACHHLGHLGAKSTATSVEHVPAIPPSYDL